MLLLNKHICIETTFLHGVYDYQHTCYIVDGELIQNVIGIMNNLPLLKCTNQT